MTIRRMEAGDVDRICQEFRNQNWPKPREVLEGYWEKQERGSLRVFVAQEGTDIAGYVILRPVPEAGPFAGKPLPEIGDLIVFIPFQRRGIGSALLDAAEKAAAEGSGRVSLGVGLHSGYGAAQRIYAKRGYLPEGSGVWYQDRPLEPYAPCRNDDDLILYMCKNLKNNTGRIIHGP